MRRKEKKKTKKYLINLGISYQFKMNKWLSRFLPN